MDPIQEFANVEVRAMARNALTRSDQLLADAVDALEIALELSSEDTIRIALRRVQTARSHLLKTSKELTP